MTGAHSKIDPVSQPSSIWCEVLRGGQRIPVRSLYSSEYRRAEGEAQWRGGGRRGGGGSGGAGAAADSAPGVNALADDGGVMLGIKG